jgi:hypothetical protein
MATIRKDLLFTSFISEHTSTEAIRNYEETKVQKIAFQKVNNMFFPVQQDMVGCNMCYK